MMRSPHRETSQHCCRVEHQEAKSHRRRLHSDRKPFRAVAIRQRSWMASLLSLFVVLSLPCFSISFHLNPRSRIVTTTYLYSSTRGENQRRSVKNSKKKKPRFTQQQDSSTGRPTTERSSRRIDPPPQRRLVDRIKASSSTVSSQHPPFETANRRTSSNVPPKVNKERMWKREVSIDELESRLSKRWGTDLSKWTASDEFEDDDDSTTEDESSPVPNRIGRPVKDPWLSETKHESDPVEETTPALRKKPSALGAFVHQTADAQKSSPLSAFGPPRPTMDLSHLIADTPAGGEHRPIKKKQKRVEKQPIPLTHNGAPLYLTLEQAEQFFRESSGSEVGAPFETEEEQTSWSDLGISDGQLLENLSAMGCEQPLAVQRNSCQQILSGVDAVVGTYTGSGKTLAFLVPILEKMVRQPELQRKLRLIVVAPGRELASQITTVARDVVEGTNLTVQLAIGGTTFSRNLEMIRKRKPDILIGTPGRIAALVVGEGDQRRGRLAVQHLETLVCDEFDALLEYKAHRDPTHALLTTLKRQRRDRLQTILCSATASDMLKAKKKINLEENYLRSGYVITMADDNDSLVTSGGSTKTRVSRTVMHGVVHVPHRRFALETVRRILHTEPLPQQILIFVSDARRVPIVVDRLADRGIVAAPLHGDSDKTDRAEVSKALRDGYVGIVVSTELAARGLDAPLLTHVINMDLPTDASHYAHRAGRCGRGGRPGVVINLTTSPQERKVPERMADELGIDMYTVDVKNSKLNVIDPASVELDALET